MKNILFAFTLMTLVSCQNIPSSESLTPPEIIDMPDYKPVKIELYKTTF